MQHPLGYVIRNGRAELEDFWAVVTQPFAVITFLHVITAAYTLTGFFVLGVSAYHIVRKRNLSFFEKSYRMAAVFTLLFSVALVAVGDLHGKKMATAQPTKLAAVESVWETQKGAPFYLFLVPDEANERNSIEILGIPKFLSLLALGDADAEIKGLKAFPKEERPPVALVFWSFRIMVGLGFLFVLVAFIAWLKRKKLQDTNPLILRLLTWMIPLPFVAASLGWIVTEVGRQPWIVYGVLKTSQTASPVADYQVAISLAAFVVVYTLLGLAAYYLIYKHATKAPEPLAESSS
jgi:cytochrome d ubiquinol oxidase subunit I